MGPKILRITWVEIPHGKGKFWGLCGPMKSSENLYFGIRCKRIIQSPITSCTERDHSIINNGTNGNQSFDKKLWPLIVIIIINRGIRELTQNQSMQQYIQTVSHIMQVSEYATQHKTDYFKYQIQVFLSRTYIKHIGRRWEKYKVTNHHFIICNQLSECLNISAVSVL